MVSSFLVLGLVRRVTSGTFAVLRRLVLHFGRCDAFLDVLMALGTELAVRLDQQLLVLGLVRGMAGGAFAVLRGLVLHLGGGDALLDVLMALGAQLAVRL